MSEEVKSGKQSPPPKEETGERAEGWQTVEDAKRKRRSAAKRRRDVARREALKKTSASNKTAKDGKSPLLRATDKRPRSETSTPSPAGAMKKPRRQVGTSASASTSTGRSYREVVSNDLLMVIYAKNTPGGKLNAVQADSVEKQLKDAILGCIRTKQGCPGFLSFRFGGEVIKTRCEDVFSKEVVEANKMPSLTKASLFCHGEMGQLSGIQEVLTGQNPDLDVDSRHLLHSDKREDGTLLVMGIPEEGIQKLKAKNMKMRFFLQQVTVKVSGRNEEGGAPQASPPRQTSGSQLDGKTMEEEATEPTP